MFFYDSRPAKFSSDTWFTADRKIDYRARLDHPLQKIHQRASSVSQQKIVNIHGLGAETAVLQRLEQFQPPTPIVHWYAGPLNLIDRYLAVGAYFTFGVELLYGKKIEKILAAIPQDRLLTETDNPGAYKHFAHQPGTPGLIQQVTAKMARRRQLSEVKMEAIIEQNFIQIIASNPTLIRCWQAAQDEN
ncbi:TatD family hydrolase [Candidatus Leptofilum sp.]|uniref:TatD family hydrolase n=1 Tax=Candidatus Leptofilum sp. TaxID=3241576 RepID=UPI003B58D1D7